MSAAADRERHDMTALQITSMKLFMSRLLASDTFDCFLLEEAVIGTASTFTIDGRINREFFAGQAPEEDETAMSSRSGQQSPSQEFRPWSELRGLCYDLIKGKRPPLFFRFTGNSWPPSSTATPGTPAPACAPPPTCLSTTTTRRSPPGPATACAGPCQIGRAHV